VSHATRWPFIQLVDAFWFQEGPGVRNWQFTTEGIKLLNVANIEKDGSLNLAKTDRHLDKLEVKKKYSHFLIDPGDLVIASSGISFDEDGLLRTRGAFVRESDVPLCLNTSTIRFKAIGEKSDVRFLRHWLDGNEFRSQITKLVTGTAQQNFGPSHLKLTKITLPPLTEQRRIAAILDQAEALRSKRRSALGQLNVLLQAIFFDIFGLATQKRSRFPSFRLGDVTHFIDYRGISPNKQPDGVRLVTARNIKRGWFQNEPQEFIPEDEYESWMSRGMPRTGDVLFTTEGHTLGSAAKLPRFEKAALAQRLIALQPLESICSDYLLQVVLGQDFQKEIVRRSTGSAARGISSRQLAEIAIPLPPLQLQNEFTRRVETVENLRAFYRDSLEELNALFASLQHRAFRGEL
jgi:type I restriction enzyme S subunit